MTISDKIFELLKKRGMSQKEFAEQTGIAPSAISDWKRKHTNPVSEKIMIICQTLNVTVEELLSGTEGTGTRNKPVDYIIISKESELGAFVQTYQNLPSDVKARVLGYMTGIIEELNK